MKTPVIVEAVRTPIARKGGAYAGVRSDQLAATALNALIERTKVSPEAVSDVILGCVTETGEQGANLARQAGLLSKFPQTTAAVTLSRLCGSAQQAIHFAAQTIAAGDADFVVGGGVENMTRVPMFSDIGGGFHTLNPELLKKYELIHQGESAERIATKYSLSRQAVDEFSAESHRRAARAIAEGRFQSQYVKVEGSALEVDEGVRANPDLAKMGTLATIFKKDGVVTAANASQISDGAAAVLVADAEAAKAHGLKARAKFRARVALGGDPTLQLMEVVPATQIALKKAGLTLNDIGVIEINEAFATVVLGWGKELKPNWDKVNPNGGAIAHGHPLGATGAALMTKLLYELERTNQQFGLQVMCIGHGMATATIIERV